MIEQGQRLPVFVAAASDRSSVTPDTLAGRPAVLVVATSRSDAVERRCAELAAARDALAPARLFALMPPAAGLRHWTSGIAGLPLGLGGADLLAPLGIDGGAILLTDRAGRLVGQFPLDEAPVERIQALLARCTPIAPPVLRIPLLFDASFCAELIGFFETGPSFESGVDGAAGYRIDKRRKARRDLVLPPNHPLGARVVARLAAVVVPELRRAFQHEASHTDRLLVARYDAGSGHFSRHRDDAHRLVGFRRFALSVNLDAAAFEGGALHFPEYDDAGHRPATGEALIFSASLLHEALPVTRGTRHVLLTFLHDAAAEAERRRLAA